MSALTGHAQEYLRLRRAMGYELVEHERLLPDLVAYLDAAGAATLTVPHALAWAQPPGIDPASSVGPLRMTVARGFAKYLSGLDPRTEVPPIRVLPFGNRRRTPYLYSGEDIAALMAAARVIRSPLRAATIETLIGLLAVTGLRVSEAIGLDRADVNLTDGLLLIRQSKFGNYAEGAVMPSPVTVGAACGDSAQDSSA